MREWAASTRATKYVGINDLSSVILLNVIKIASIWRRIMILPVTRDRFKIAQSHIFLDIANVVRMLSTRLLR